MGEVLLAASDKETYTGYLNKAIDNFKIATQLNPQYKSAFQFLGITYKSLGDTVNAKKYFDIAEQLQ